MPDRILGMSRSRLAALLASRTTWVAVSAACLGVAVAAYLILIPAIAAQIARRVPVAWESQLGETVSKALLLGARRCSDAASHEAVQRVTARLLDESSPHPYDIRVTIVHSSIKNAFAAPGGHVFLYTGLLSHMDTPEQLAAVLAHELQHTLLRHGTRTLFQQSAVAVLASLVVGDLGGSMAVVMDGAHTLGALAYSRHYEREADAKGVEMLRRARVDVTGMAEFFRRMEEIDPNAVDALGYFSTHPATATRIAAAEAERGSDDAEATPVMSPEDWDALQNHIGPRR